MTARLGWSCVAALLALGVVAGAARADGRQDGRHEGAQQGRQDSHRGYALDNRYQHGQYYPQRGAAFRSLPAERRQYEFHGEHYYFHGGAWYRQWGPNFLVVAPPIGIGIDLLPPYYTTVWLGGVPYYYADGAYYQWQPERRQYIVAQPPADAADAGDPAPSPPQSNDLYAYPKNGQGEQQQATDRYECHSWAAGQAGFDPTQVQGGVAADAMAAGRDSYLRAERACLEGRGYSVN
jgi:hypothetical protein